MGEPKTAGAAKARTDIVTGERAGQDGNLVKKKVAIVLAKLSCLTGNGYRTNVHILQGRVVNVRCRQVPH